LPGGADRPVLQRGFTGAATDHEPVSTGFSNKGFTRRQTMSRTVYSEIFFHAVWRTKDSLPMITKEMRPRLHNYIKHRCCETAGVFCHAIGGMPDHVHLCVSVPPTLLMSDWVGELKGASSHHINHEFRPKSLQWQAGYGVVSFGKNNLDFVKEYIERQEEHHSAGGSHERLERTEAEEG
jgi:putative transposase